MTDKRKKLARALSAKTGIPYQTAFEQLGRGAGDRRPATPDDYDDDRTVCEICDPGEDRPPALVNYSPMQEQGEAQVRVDIGRCDWCNGIAVRCRSCGTVTSVWEGEYKQPLDCEGGCGLRFVVRSTSGFSDGGGAEWVELLPEQMEDDEASDTR